MPIPVSLVTISQSRELSLQSCFIPQSDLNAPPGDAGTGNADQSLATADDDFDSTYGDRSDSDPLL